MRGLVVGVLAALFVATALSGCMDKSPAGRAASREELGTLRGLVADAAIRPLAGVQLSVQTPARTLWTNSSGTGAFAFPPLPFGAYVVHAHRLGFLDAYAAAVVDGADHALRIQLEADVEGRPYATAHLFRGFIECSFAAAGVSAGVCGVPNVPGVTGNVTNDRPYTDIPLDRAPAWMQHELVWQPTQLLGNQLRLLASGSSDDGFADLNETVGLSPLLLVEDTAALGKAGLGPGWVVELVVFAGGLEGSGGCVRPVPGAPGLCPAPSGATLEQEFDLYSHLFHGFTPPPGWRFSVDGDPVPP